MKNLASVRARCRLWFEILFALSLFSLPWVCSAEIGVPLPWIFVGESLTAGVQNAALLDRAEAVANDLGNLGQQNGYAAQLAVQARAPLSLPRILWPGFPNVIRAVDLGPPLVIERVTDPPFTLGRLNPLEQATNLAVPGTTAADALDNRPNDTCAPEDVIDDMPPGASLSNINCVLGSPGLLPDDAADEVVRSQVEWAEILPAGTIFVLLGTNEALEAVFEANPAFLTPVHQFEADYREVLERLAATGAILVAANVADETLIPFLTTTEEVAELFNLSLEETELLLGLKPGDFVTPDAFPQIVAILESGFDPLSANVVLTADEADTIRTTIDGYNDVIAQAAAEQEAVLVDLRALAEIIAAEGVVVTGQRLTFDFGAGLFSLDGVHLTNTGYAVVANGFIKTLNTELDAGIPPISLPLVRLQDPLVSLETGRPPCALGIIDSEDMQSLRLLLFD
jgi:lysophospholipase L1-like esterase